MLPITAGMTSRGLWVPLFTTVLTTITTHATQTCLGAAPSGLRWASSWGNFRARLACPCSEAGLKAAEDLRSPLPPILRAPHPGWAPLLVLVACPIMTQTLIPES